MNVYYSKYLYLDEMNKVTFYSLARKQKFSRFHSTNKSSLRQLIIPTVLHGNALQVSEPQKNLITCEESCEMKFLDAIAAKIFLFLLVNLRK